MVTTFLIGNGFDIGLGLQTRYEDFYPKYTTPKEDDTENIANFKKMLLERNNTDKEKIIDWADFEEAFGKHSEAFTLETKRDYLDRFEDFCFSFNEYLKKEEQCVDYSDKNKIAEMMKSSLHKYFNIRPDDSDAIKAVHNKYSSDRTYNFIAFNYTKTVDNCVRILKSIHSNPSNVRINDVLHIHGYLDNSMIIGVNDASQITNQELANDPDVIEEIVKPLQNSINRTAFDKVVTTTIKNSDIICIYGMSIGITDKKWWSLIADWLHQNENHILVILTHSTEYNPAFTFSQKRVVTKVLKAFLSYSALKPEFKDSIAKRIFIGANNYIFSLPLRKKPPIEIFMKQAQEAAKKRSISQPVLIGKSNPKVV